MQYSSKEKGKNIIFAACVIASALFVENTARAQESVIFVSDFYNENVTSWGSCQGTATQREIQSTDPAYEIADILDSAAGISILATEVNNCSFAGNSRDEYEDYISDVWDSFKSRTYAVPGNHDYYDDAIGFKWYFGQNTYRSLTKTVGSTTWKIIGVDSNLDGLDMFVQKFWIVDQLAGETCSIAYMHHPRWSSGEHGSDSSWDIDSLWNILHDNGVELLLSGHDHDYERFTDMDKDGNPDSNGLVQVVAGTGGAKLRAFEDEDIEDNSVVRIDNEYGTVQVYLYDGWYFGSFVDIDGNLLDYWWRSCRS